DIMSALVESAACPQVRITVADLTRFYRFTRTNTIAGNFHFAPIPGFGDPSFLPPVDGVSDVELLERLVHFGHLDGREDLFVPDADAAQAVAMRDGAGERRDLRLPGGIGSLLILPIRYGEETLGILTLVADRAGFFDDNDADFYRNIAAVIGIARAHRQAKFHLRERIKELTCIYRITKLGSDLDRSLDALLREAADIIPPAFLFPEAASCRIMLDRRSYTSLRYNPSKHALPVELRINGRPRGLIEVSYSTDLPTLDKGPFLSEERSLLESIAKEIAVIIQRKEAEEEKNALQQQLLHADRLVTVGQLAAGMAHEINEPQGAILGFSQLIQKTPDLPEQAIRDLDKIVKAAIHARDIIRKLMLFSRQMPPRKSPTDLNERVTSCLDLLEPRIRKGGVRVVTELTPDIPPIVADPAQIHQILVNLVVNAVQAMDPGGTLTIRTAHDGERVSLAVEDTGCGMTAETKDRIFVPFFTTKDIGEGTGLGLSVVLGIVTAHGGDIKVESEPGRGSRFTVTLPLAAPEKGEDHG
ncbi:MAG TPA: ATP-binding protein, partial [bacterium]|nr:ATP-binding protein [bacterium]